jgi:hypothetical protein
MIFALLKSLVNKVIGFTAHRSFALADYANASTMLIALEQNAPALKGRK